jgi:hypothetical protein
MPGFYRTTCPQPKPSHRSEKHALAEQLAHAWLQRAAADASEPRQRAEAAVELARLDGTVPAEVQGTGAALRSATAALAHVRCFAPFGMGLAERFVNRALAQVTSYLIDESVRAYALDKVASLIDPDTMCWSVTRSAL